MVTKRIHIVHVITTLATGGAEMMLYKVLRNLDYSTFRCSVIVLSQGGKIQRLIQDLGVEVHTPRFRSVLSFPFAFHNLVKILRKLNPDIIQGWLNHGNVLSQLSAPFLKYKVPICWNVRQSLSSISHYKKWHTRLFIRLGSLLSGSAKLIIYNSLTGRAQHENFGFCPDRATYIPNGFDLSDFQPAWGAKEKFRSSIGLPVDAFLIGLIARDRPMKDHETFLAAAAELSKLRPEVRFVLAGGGMSYDNHRIASLIEKHAIAPVVHLLGEFDSARHIIPGLDIVTLTSAWGEGFPNVVGEAMACGVPCVVTDVGDCARILGSAGKLFQPRDIQGLIAGWEYYLNMDQLSLKALAVASRRKIEEQYSINLVTKQYEKVYSDLVTRVQNRLRVGGL